MYRRTNYTLFPAFVAAAVAATDQQYPIRLHLDPKEINVTTKNDSNKALKKHSSGNFYFFYDGTVLKTFLNVVLFFFSLRFK
jgi:hypothetical protein